MIGKGLIGSNRTHDIPDISKEPRFRKIGHFLDWKAKHALCHHLRRLVG